MYVWQYLSWLASVGRLYPNQRALRSMFFIVLQQQAERHKLKSALVCVSKMVANGV